MEARVGVDGGSATRKFLQHHHSRPQPPPPQISQIGTVPQLLVGGIAGAFGKTCTAPLARLTILFQVCRIFFQFHPLPFNCARFGVKKVRRNAIIIKRQPKNPLYFRSTLHFYLNCLFPSFTSVFPT